MAKFIVIRTETVVSTSILEVEANSKIEVWAYLENAPVIAEEELRNIDFKIMESKEE